MLPSRDEALWDCACECALRRQDRACKHRFGSMACNSCDVYIKQYGDFSPQDAKLYMMEAGKFAYSLKSDHRRYYIVFGMIAALIALVLFANAQERKRVAREQEVFSISQTLTAKGIPSSATVYPYITDALIYTEQQLSNKVDVNGDGLTNCIDAAVLFYGHYPYKQDVTIESNFHPDGRMSHLFNVVRVNGAWRAVEPQAYWKGHASYWMKDVWGDAYDNRYNVDETEKYKKYVMYH